MNNDIDLKSYFSEFNPEIADNNFMELLSLKLDILDQIQLQQQRAKREIKTRLITILSLGIISTSIIRRITSIEIVSLAVATYIILIGIILHYFFSQHSLKHIRILSSQIKHITQAP